jgi:hypothetical protein
MFTDDLVVNEQIVFTHLSDAELVQYIADHGYRSDAAVPALRELFRRTYCSYMGVDHTPNKDKQVLTNSSIHAIITA